MATINNKRVLAVVDSTGMVWLNPSDVDEKLDGVTPLFTETQVEQALLNMERRMENDAAMARAANTLDIEASAAEAADVSMEEIAFATSMQKLGM